MKGHLKDVRLEVEFQRKGPLDVVDLIELNSINQLDKASDYSKPLTIL